MNTNNLDAHILHYDVIKLRLAHEVARAVAAKTEKERVWREHNCNMINKELAEHVEFLKKNYGVDPTPVVLDEEDEKILSMTDDEILKELGIE